MKSKYILKNIFLNKFNKNQGYKIQVGDYIKLGRVRFRIKEIKMSEED